MHWETGPEETKLQSRLDWWAVLVDRPIGEISFLLELSGELPKLPEREVITGLGYSPMHGWRPLILLDAERLGVRPEIEPVEPSDVAFPLEDLLVGPFADLRHALVLPAGTPEPLSGYPRPGLVGDRATRQCSSVGVRAVRSVGVTEWRPGFLTAGHTFADGVGTPVVRLPARGLQRQIVDLAGRRWARRIGTVAVHEAPPPGLLGNAGPPGFDYAMVDLDETDGAPWREAEFAMRMPAPPTFTEPRRVSVTGGVTGLVDRVSLMGALMNVGHRWRDCWMLGPSSALAKGDSGSAVHLYDSGESLGMVVGRTTLMDEVHHVYVQSLERLMAECLMPDVRIELRQQEALLK